MKNQAGYEEAEYGDVTAFERFVEFEDIPSIQGVVVEDVRTLELQPWKKMGGKGAYIGHVGNPRDPQVAVAYVVEIRPKAALEPQKCACEELVYVHERIRSKQNLVEFQSPTEF